MEVNQPLEASGIVPPFKFKTIQQLYDSPPENTRYLVDNLLPTGGFSILIGKPKAGKTTLVRQLAVAVAQGKPFLKRQTQQGAVLYIAMEEKEAEVRRHFSDLGLLGSDPVYIYCDHVERKRSVATLEATLTQNPGIKLVIIDPIFRFVTLKDANDYLQVTNALQGLMTMTRDSGVHILLVHHRKKRETDDLTDGALGSTAISGSVDTYIDLRKDTAGIRMISSDQRYGTNLEATQLIWNAKSRSLELGETAERLEKGEAKRSEERITQEIINYLTDHPGCTQGAVDEAVRGKTMTKRAMFRAIVDQGLVEREGQGTKSDPFKYSLRPVPTEREGE